MIFFKSRKTIKLSKIVLEMAITLLKNPRKPPSSEAAHAALLFVHVAWNKSLGNNDILSKYKGVLSMFEKENPSLWNEFKITNHIDIISSLVDYKQRFYSDDYRNIMVCGMREGNVHVEWTD
jgi:hypothetical protein